MSRVYPDYGHPQGIGSTPWFRISGAKLLPDYGHPQGIGSTPWFRIS